MNMTKIQPSVEEKIDKIEELLKRVTTNNLVVAICNPITVYEGIFNFIQYKLLNEISAKYKRDIIHNLKWLLICCDVKIADDDLMQYNCKIKSLDITCLEYEQFMLDLYTKYFRLQNKKQASYTVVRRRKLYLNNLINYMIRCKHLTKNVVKNDKFLPKGKQAIAIDTDYEFEDMINIINHIYNKYPKFGVFFAILLFTGIRIEEAKGLQYGDFKKDHIVLSRAVSVSHTKYTKTSNSYEVRELKHRPIGTIRKVPITKQLTTYLNVLQLEKNEMKNFIFDPVINYSRAWRRALKELEYDSNVLKPSILRKMFITRALEGFKVTDAGAIAGNTANVIYKHYAMRSIKSIKDQKNKLEHLFRDTSHKDEPTGC